MTQLKTFILSAAIAASISGTASASVFSRLGIHMPGSQPAPNSQQQDQQGNQSADQQTEARKNARREAGKAGLRTGAKGCLAGGLASLLSGGNVIRGCAIGGVAAGVTEGISTYQNQMKDWQNFQRSAVNDGARVKIETREVAVKNAKTGEVEKATAPKSMTVSLVAADVADHGKDTRALLRRTASLADASKIAITIRVNGNASERSWVMSELRSDLRADTTATLKQGSAGSAELVLTPAPQIGE